MRSATTIASDGSIKSRVSIHALTRSATNRPSSLCIVCSFQSTHSRGVRLCPACITIAVTVVSIHALTRSATKSFRFPCEHWTVSIHALTRSATQSVVCSPKRAGVSIHALTRSATSIRRATCSTRLFQSTHSRGVRQRGRGKEPAHAGFNPRTHEECDQL